MCYQVPLQKWMTDYASSVEGYKTILAKENNSPNDNTLVTDQTRDANARFPLKDL